MKQMFKRVMSVLLVVVLILPMFCVNIVQVHAKKIEYQQIMSFFMMPDDPHSAEKSFNLIVNKNDKVKNAKSYNEDIIRTRSIKIKNLFEYGSKYVIFNFKMRKPGTAVISYTVNGKKEYAKITGIAYKNPIRSISIAGITKKGKKDLASLTEKDLIVSSIKLTKTKKNAQVNIKTKGGMKIRSITCYAQSGTEDTKVQASKTWKKPVSSAKCNVGTLRAGKRYQIHVEYSRPGTNGGSIEYIINQK